MKRDKIDDEIKKMVEESADEEEMLAGADEAARHLLETMSQQISFYTMVVGYLLARIEATSPEAAIEITDVDQKKCVGLQIMMGRSDGSGTFQMFIPVDAEYAKELRVREVERLKRIMSVRRDEWQKTWTGITDEMGRPIRSTVEKPDKEQESVENDGA